MLPMTATLVGLFTRSLLATITVKLAFRDLNKAGRDRPRQDCRLLIPFPPNVKVRDAIAREGTGGYSHD